MLCLHLLFGDGFQRHSFLSFHVQRFLFSLAAGYFTSNSKSLRNDVFLRIR
jgi:hypothetical protein